MIIRLAENGGVVMINFGSRFLTERAKEYEFNRRDEFMSYLETSGMENSRDLQKEFNDKYAAENGAYPYATVAETLDHFDHVVNLTSVDHVGIGSDYDGIGDTLPIDLKDVSSYPALVEGLLGRGYSESDIKKILGGNLLRVWREVEAVAAEMSKLTEQS